MFHRLRPVAALALLGLFAGSAAQAASFDCNKARTPMEKAICSDMKLSALDDELNAAYKAAAERSGNKEAIRRWQRDWLKSYEVTHCTDAACWQVQFSERIAALRNVAGSQEPTARWNGHYVRDTDGRKATDPASITLIGLNGNRILASGNALWEGPNAANGQVHTGEIDGIGSLRGAQAVFELDGCSATLVLEAQGLAVLEESGCGGLNVSFVGRYRREK